MPDARLPGFLPSTHGFRFANRWPPGPAFSWRVGYLTLGVGNVADGLCGGMCFAVADRLVAGRRIPADAAPPPAGSMLFREIAGRQLDSLALGQVPLRFWATAARLELGAWSARDQVREWLAIRADLQAGRPAMVGLVRRAGLNPFRLTVNHQVLAYAVDATSTAGSLRVYDPNHPGRDDVELRVRVDAGEVSLAQSTGEPLRALLRLPYRPAPPGQPGPGEQ